MCNDFRYNVTISGDGTVMLRLEEFKSEQLNALLCFLNGFAPWGLPYGGEILD